MKKKTAVKKEPLKKTNSDAFIPPSDVMFRALAESAASAIIIFRNEKLYYVNKAMEILTGYSQREILTMNFQELIHPQDIDMVLSLPLNNQDGEALSPHFEFKIITKSGEQRWIDFSASLIEYEDQRVGLGTAFDITERKKTEEALTQTEAALRQRADELGALHALSSDIAAPLDLSSLLHKIVQRSVELLHASGGAIALCDEERKQVRLEAEHYNKTEGLRGVIFKYGEGATGWVAQTGKPLIIDDYRSWPGRAIVYEDSQPYSAVLSVPMSWKGHVTGVLQVLDDGQKRQFTQADMELLSLFASPAAVAIENARLFEAERTARVRSEAIRQASLGLTASLELTEVLDTILKTVLDLLPDANNSHIYLYNPEDGGHLTFGSSLWADGRRGKSIADPRPQGITYSVARSGETIVVTNMGAHPLYADAPSDWKGAIIGLPLKIGQRVVGVMNVSYERARHWEENELQLLRLLGDQAAIAIENARLFTRATIEHQHLSLLFDIGHAMAASLDPEVILKQAITLTCEALEGLVGQAFIYSPDSNQLFLKAIYGLQDQWTADPDYRIVLQAGEGLAGWVGVNQQPVYLPNVLEDGRWIHIPGVDEGVHSAISAPILGNERLLGVISVLHNRENAFSSDHLSLIQAICQEVGLALSNATRYQQAQRQLAEITFIQNLAQTFNRRLEVQELLNEVVLQLADRLGYPLVEIFLIDGDELLQRAAFGVKTTSERVQLSQGIIGRVARTGSVALILNVSLDPDYLPSYPDTIAELVVPIFHGSVVVGVINIETNQPDQLTNQDRDLVEVLAGQISIALENAVLYEHLREHAQDLEHIVNERTSELVALYELSQKIGYTLSNGELLQMLLSHLRIAARSDVVVGGLFVEGQHMLYVETSRPISPASMNQLHSYWLDAIRRQGLPIEDFEDIPIDVISRQASPSSEAPIANIASLIQSPILVSGDVVGILIAGCEEEGAFGEAEARILDTFANQATAGIQRLAALLAAEQKRLEGLVEHLPVGVLLLDSEHRLLMSNPLGREHLSILNSDYTSGQLTHLGSLEIKDLIARQNDPIPLEINLPGPHRRVFVAQVGPAGEDSHHWVLTLREVTQERENQARIQMQERLATVGQLAAGIAHDFNNIMAAILVYTDLLAEDPEIPASSRDRLQTIKQQVQRAASLIRQILDFSRRSVMEQSDLDVLPFIKELDKMLRRVLPETIQLELSYKAGSYLVHADPTRLQQAFMNLALNARDAMPNGGTLRYELDHLIIEPGQRPPMEEMRAGEWVRISVKDTGAGIRTDHLPHVFEPFFTTKPVGQGTGLGLAQVYGIIKQHDGYIDVKSQTGHGTIFTIYLPAIDEPQADEHVIETIVRVDGVGKKVLVVEDDRATREALQALLEAHHYGVVTAWNGLEAMKYMDENPAQIDLVISDVVMPQMGGVALFKVIQERWPKMKVLLVTGHPMEGRNQELLEKGKINWLQKPFSAQTFNQTVFSLLQE